MSPGRKIAMILSAGAILTLSVLGGMNGIDGITSEGTLLQKSVSVASVLYGVLGIAAGAGVLLRRRWSYPLAIMWSIVVLAPLVGAFLLCVVVSGLIVWCVHITMRPSAQGD